MKFFSIISKNFLLFFHSKLSSMIIIFGPLLLILIIGAGLGNTGIKDVQANVYISEESPFTNLFLERLEAKSFIITKTSSVEECKAGIKNSNKNICIDIEKYELVLPTEIEVSQIDLDKSGAGYKINLHVDFSRQRIVWGLINSVNSVVDTFSRNIRDITGLRFKNKLKEYASEVGTARVKLRIIKNNINSLDSKIDEVDNLLPDLNSINKIDTQL